MSRVPQDVREAGGKPPQHDDDDAWRLYDPPFVYKTRKLGSFLPFLLSPNAKFYVIIRLTSYEIVLHLSDDRGSAVLFEGFTSSTPKAEKQKLCEVLEEHPSGMARMLRERMGWFVRAFFGVAQAAKKGGE